MEENIFSVNLPNTHRDVNDILPLSKDEYQVKSSTNLSSEPMDYENSASSSDRLSNVFPPARNDAPLARQANKKSIISPVVNRDNVENEVEDDHQARSVHRAHLMNSTASRSDKSDLCTNGNGDEDPDAALARLLQEEEYSKDTMIGNQFIGFPFDPEVLDGTARSQRHPQYSGRILNSDEELAMRMQRRENRFNGRCVLPFPGCAPRQSSDWRSNPSSERDDSEVFPPLHYRREVPFHPTGDDDRVWQNNHNDDDDENDEDDARRHRAFFRFLANAGAPIGGPFFHMHPSFVRRRRDGPLQNSAEDFGPEDYERLLQLDDSIQKKTLTKQQIDKIPTEQFTPSAAPNDDGNKCGICLDDFEDQDTLRKYPCNHRFHKKCSDRWLHESNACPVCREAPVKPPPSSTSQSRSRKNPSSRPSNNQQSTNHRTRPPAPTPPFHSSGPRTRRPS